MNTAQPNDDLLLVTLDEAARRLSVHRRTLEREISAGRFPNSVKIGRARRVPVAALVDYLKALGDTPQQA